MLLTSVVVAIAFVAAFLVGRHLRQKRIDQANQPDNVASGDEAMKNTLRS